MNTTIERELVTIVINTFETGDIASSHSYFNDGGDFLFEVIKDRKGRRVLSERASTAPHAALETQFKLEQATRLSPEIQEGQDLDDEQMSECLNRLTDEVNVLRDRLLEIENRTKVNTESIGVLASKI